MRGKPPTASATLVQTFSAEGKVAPEPWIWQAGRQKTATQVTTSLQPRKMKDEWRLLEMSVGWRTETDLNEWDFQFCVAVRVSNPHVSQVTRGSQDMAETGNRRTMFPGRLWSRSSRSKSTSNKRVSSYRTFFVCSWGASLLWRCNASETWILLFCHVKHYILVTVTRSLMCWIEKTMTRMSTALLEQPAHTKKLEMKIF